ncbi:hypothetical protein BDQ12DRAFT_689885 [Crucibulum laeve]|uniref:C2H2-type domain-containing protein n=1 Tax=Crucibulum laeve TaxID=68775 RepID=A0A5C3LNN4_9AGAR|nr:hypothetical protein BDQ12DRAFT_689885 [Crucibulum laeve]
MEPSPHSSPTVSLPSIHEMFPEHLMRKNIQDRERPSPHRGDVPSHSDLRPSSSHSSRSIHAQLFHHPHSHARSSSYAVDSASSPHPSHRHAGSSRLLSQSESVSSHWSHASLGADPMAQRRRSDPHVFPFNVLRSDPTSSSLQHVASSATLPNRGPNSVGTHIGIASGSSPTFRVFVPSTAGAPIERPSYPTDRSGPPNAPAPHREAERHRKYTHSDPSYPAIISFPISGPPTGSVSSNSGYSRDESGNASDDESPSEGNSGKKHVCPTCLKRFNRPSSLRIHVNTHTGATPFRCPWPNCGREFNVNSNMRRHYRNHNTPGFSRTQPTENRRRRRRMAPPPGHATADTGAPNMRRLRESAYIASPPISSFSVSEDSGDDVSDSMDGDVYSKQDIDEEDELLEYESHMDDSSESYRTSSLTQSMARVAVAPERPRGPPEHAPSSRPRHYSQSNIRSLTPGSSFHSSSPSPSLSPSPPPNADHAYKPSSDYVRSLADSRVSTALRPAFHVRRTISDLGGKDERLGDAW